ncbi:MAG: tetratricopeptide repeat protein [Spirochaetia bacterium]|nr:tetratricopeptide repeat protein [Spirochaetia bacterium]
MRRLIIAAIFLVIGASLFAAPDSGPLIKRAEEHFFQKRFRTALVYLRQARDIDPENPVIHSYMGDVYLVTGSLDEAEECFRTALELTKEPAREYFRLGQVLYLKKKPEAALAAYKSALEKNPGLAAARFQMGLVYYMMRDKEKTVAEWKEFLRLLPEDPQRPDIERAIALLSSKDFQFPADDKAKLPDPASSRIPYMKGDTETERESNKTENIIQKDDL